MLSKVVLHDFCDDTTLYDMLKQQMRSNKEFKLILHQTLPSENNNALNFLKPFDVKYSRQCNCIIVSDEHGLNFIDSRTYKLRMQIEIGDAAHLCVEYAEGCDDQLIITTVSFCSEFRKYDLKTLLFSCTHQYLISGCIWKISRTFVTQGMTFSKTSAQSGFLFVASHYDIHVFNSITGAHILQISNPVLDAMKNNYQQSSCSGLHFANGYLWMSNENVDICTIYQFSWNDAENKLTLLKSNKFKCRGANANGIVNVQDKYLILTDSKGRVLMFRKHEFKFLKKFETTGSQSLGVALKGLCWNNDTRELYVCNFDDNKVHVFR